MKEGWNAFRGDCSHAWGATPTYQLPIALSGFEMIKAGFEEFTLSPNLFSLDYADISIPTPVGRISVHLKKGSETAITIPDGIVKLPNGNYTLR